MMMKSWVGDAVDITMMNEGEEDLLNSCDPRIFFRLHPIGLALRALSQRERVLTYLPIRLHLLKPNTEVAGCASGRQSDQMRSAPIVFEPREDERVLP